MYKAIKKVFKRSLWTMLAVFFAILLAIFAVGSHIANGNQAAINGFLHTNPYKQISTGDSSGIDTDYFPSDYTKKDSNGNTIYEKDKDGIWHAVYDNEAMRANSQAIALQAAVEGSVILRNKDGGLPLAEESRVSMFGMSTVNYAYVGMGSGEVAAAPPESMRDEFARYGLKMNMPLFIKYTQLGKDKRYVRNNRYAVNEAPWSEVESTVSANVTSDETAVLLISRVTGETADIFWTGQDSFMDSGNYLDLSKNENEILEKLIAMRNGGKLKKVVLLINSSNALQFRHIDELDLDACVWIGMGGAMSYAQIAAVLSGRGEYVVSGHLPDTFAFDNDSAPANVNLGDYTFTQYSDRIPDLDIQGKEQWYSHNIKYIAYQEGIYVGYRYYETRYEDAVLGQGGATTAAGSTEGGAWNYNNEVAYPFGYGESYTDFTYGGFKVERNENGIDYDVSLTITNSGMVHSGKETLQVYLQKPYTDYDKNPEHRIEKAAVELVGFAKTKKLAPGEPQTLTVTVKEEDFKTYDAYGERTYIFEEGNYYLAFGTDAHDALNNILAAKGYTTAQGMDYNGKAEFAHRITVDGSYKGYALDKFKNSAYTGAEITNRFDDADINLYEGTADQKISYLSRGDWQGSFPTQAVKLECVNDKMAEDMMYGHHVEAKEEEKIPVYGTVTSDLGKLTLTMLIDKPFDDPLWQDLLNQTTVAEQQKLISYGLNHLAGVPSVAAPGTESRDGPAGILITNPDLHTQMGFPGEVLLAATFDMEVIEKLGRAFGMEILHVGYTVIYGPGCGLHRSAISGRNWEYFSEDGFLSGKLLAAEVRGIQKYGVIVETKHCVLNDQEVNRIGIATFANEQSIREIYLRPFEIGVTEGKMNGVMTSFNRIGCTWAGAHKGLLTDVLRGEWNFDGMVETDSCSGTTSNVQHMTDIHAIAEGLLAGNDVWMCGSGDTEFIQAYVDEGNATVLMALRQAVHRILYAQLHSNAMNGMDASTRIIEVKVWWQKLLDGMIIVLSILVTALVAMSVASFIVNTSWYKERLRASRTAAKERKEKIAACEIADTSFKACWRSMDKKGRIMFFVSVSLMFVMVALSVILPVTLARGGNDGTGGGHGADIPPAVHVCGHVCDKCGKCTSDCDDSACADKCQGHPHECESLCPICGKCYNLGCQEEVCTVNGKCGDGKNRYAFEAENADYSGGPSKDLVVYDYGGGKYLGQLDMNSGASVAFTVNTKSETTASLFVRVSRRNIDTVFTDTLLVTVNGKEYKSKAVIPATDDGEGWTDFITVNLGCIRLDAGNNSIAFTVFSNSDYSGYNFDKIELACDAELTGYVAPHECSQKCPICNGCLDLDCTETVCADKCGVDGAIEYKFEAENARFKDGMFGVSTKTIGDRTAVTGLNRNNGASLEFTVYIEHDGTVNISAMISQRQFEVDVNDFFEIACGNSQFITTARVPPASGVDSAGFYKVNLGCMNLKAGKNIITFAVKTASDIGFDFDYITIAATEEASETPPDWYIESVGYRFEAENTARTAGRYTLDFVEYDGVPVVRNIAGNVGGKITFTLYSEFDATAILSVALVPAKTSIKLTDIFDVTLNGTPLASDAVIVGADVKRSVETVFGTIDLIDGKDHGANVIEFTIRENDSEINFFDYIILETRGCEVSETYMLPTSDGHAHTFADVWTHDDERHWHSGNCEHTFKKQDLAPHSFNADNVCSVCGYTRSYKYEAEWAKMKQGNFMPSVNGSTVGGLDSNPGAALMFAVYSPSASTQKLYINMNLRGMEQEIDGVKQIVPYRISDGFIITVNNKEFISDATVSLPADGSLYAWGVYEDVYLGEVRLVAGMNYFVFAIGNTNQAGNVDYFMFQGDVLVSGVATYDGNEGLYEAECAELIGGAKIDGSKCLNADGSYSYMVGDLNAYVGNGLKFTVYSTRAQKVKVIAGVTKRDRELRFNGAFDVYFNNSETPLADEYVKGTVPVGDGGNDQWTVSTEIEVCEAELAANADNTFTFKVKSSDIYACFNFDYIKLVPVTE